MPLMLEFLPYKNLLQANLRQEKSLTLEQLTNPQFLWSQMRKEPESTRDCGPNRVYVVVAVAARGTVCYVFK